MVLVVYRYMILSASNINKTILYFKRNGIKNTVNAVLERLEQKRQKAYEYAEPDSKELDRQRGITFEYEPLISVLVPCYETKPVFLEDLVLSLEDQTYQNFEIVLADASTSNHVERLANDLNQQYGNISYHRLDENLGISGNTNKGLEMCKGRYIGLLDHDDLLTPDCLFRVVEKINEYRARYGAPMFIYTDEDKTDTYLEKYYDPNIKPAINMDLLLTNNYICHFSVFRDEVIRELQLRSEYDGAQDFDLVLRTTEYLKEKFGDEWKNRVIHVPYVLYHWRCHEESTASNPASKNYAYESGLRAVQDYLDRNNIKAEAVNLRHVGFYRVNYDDVFAQRPEIGAVGGPVYSKGRICGGLMDAKCQVVYEGLKQGFSGYLHRAVLQQEAQALDIRNIIIREDLADTFKKETGYDYPLNMELIKNVDPEEIKRKSIKFCNKLRNSGIKLLYDPETEVNSSGS